jgi:outer membrane protein OmpA-like peptidoglycan-associated protein
MKNLIRPAMSLTALSLMLGACASTPVASPRLLAAEASLQRAKADAATMETSRATLDKADAALRDARENYEKGKDNGYTHMIRMGEGYVALAGARGMQLDANRKIEALNTERAEVVSQARLGQVRTAEAETVEARTDAANSEAGRIAAETRAAALTAELATYEQTKTELGVTLILRDLQFASGSSVLTAGAKGRLTPLASYLAKQPDARIQIAGHTDSQGAESYNLDLSSARAASVGTYLVSTGVAANRITSLGLGEGSPVSSNATAAGRAINRRVEVTILD